MAVPSEYPDAAEFVTPARVRLTGATRHLIDAVLTAEAATEAELDDAAEATEALATRLQGLSVLPDRPGGVRSRRETDHGDYLPRSPLVGEANPIAPPLTYELRDGRVHAHGRFPAACEGPPGYVHGGWVALAFDEILGIANISSGHPGMTGTLRIKYRRPTPLGREATMEGWTDRAEGRRIVAKGLLRVDGVLTAEAEGLFVVIRPDQAMDYFGSVREGYEPE